MSSLLERAVPTTVATGLRDRLCDSRPTGRVPITERELFDVLADGRRRGAIDRLAGADGPVSRRALAADLAVQELHMARAHVPDSRVDEIDAELERTHLPMLEDAGIVRRDVGEAEVSPGHSLEPIADWLDEVERLVEPLPDRQCDHGRNSLATPWVPTDEA